ncbi:hypothetical protein LTR53_017205 [Teratosphaeriaceae sp. CCFEE 6253]|nr:hypothetical protein LTR53_017205 [Teratosphaeriaceae sp. CCFEE 6253]
MATPPHDLYERIRATMLDFLASYDQGAAGKAVKALSRTLTPDCRRYLLPISIAKQAPALAAGTSNEEYEQMMLPEFTHVWDHWHIETRDILVDERARKAVANTVNYMTSKQGQTYDMEFVWKLQVTADGTKVEKVEEFVDTAVVAQVIADQKGIAEALPQ